MPSRRPGDSGSTGAAAASEPADRASLAAAPLRTLYVAPHGDDAAPGDAVRPLATISQAAALAGPGDEVVIAGGIYRETVVQRRDGTADRPIVFRAAPGAHVVVTGADAVASAAWRREDPSAHIFSTEWSHDFRRTAATTTHPNDDYHELIGRVEQVWVQGYALRQVLRRELLTRGTFCVDQDAGRLFVWSADNRDLSKGLLVEAAARRLIWSNHGDYVTLHGLHFRYAANFAQEGAVQLHGRHDRLSACTIERTNGVGAAFLGEDIAVEDCLIKEHGQLGFAAVRAHRLHVRGVTVRGNNTKGYNRDWEAGGNKLVLCRDVVIESGTFCENRGHGIWFDIGNERATVRNCLIAHNEDAGIFYEISYGLHAHDNVITGNGFARSPGAWGAQAGISLSSSPGCTIERNLLAGNKEGFAFREQRRTTPLPDDPNERPVWNHDQIVRRNVLAYNQDAQVWGWFDTKDGREWPRGLRPEAPAGDLSLADLQFDFHDNLYALQPGQGLFHWGVPWGVHRNYVDLECVRAELGLEQGGRRVELDFADFARLDLRLPAGSVARRADAYPKGEVPGVRLGVADGSA